MATMVQDNAMTKDMTPRELLEKADGCLQSVNHLRLTSADIAQINEARRHIDRARQMIMASYRPIEIRRGGGSW